MKIFLLALLSFCQMNWAADYRSLDFLTEGYWPTEMPSGAKDELNESIRNSASAFVGIEENIRKLKRESETFPVLIDETSFPKKNRYTDVRPYLFNIVKPDGIAYFNASKIEHFDQSMQPERINFISTQAPNVKESYFVDSTIVDFWRVIWEQETNTILMLTKFEERRKNKAERYWPERVGERLIFGDFEISTKEVRFFVGITATLFSLKNGLNEREIYHFHYTEWPDFGIPHGTHTLRWLMHFAKKSAAKKENAPVMVHCSAGIGRAGTFIGSMMAHYFIAHRKGLPDIPKLVEHLKLQRYGMVQTKEQYEFILRVLRDLDEMPISIDLSLPQEKSVPFF